MNIIIKRIVKSTLMLAFITLINPILLHAEDIDHDVMQANVTVHLPNALNDDSLELLVFEDNYLEFPFLMNIQVISATSSVNDGVCVFKVNVDNGPKYFVIRKKGGLLQSSEHFLIEKNIIESGDDVNVYLLNNDEVLFSGKGSDKMHAMYAFRKEYGVIKDSIRNSLLNVPEFENIEMEYAYRIINGSRSQVDYWTNKLVLEKENYSSGAYGILIADLTGSIQEITVNSLLFKFHYSSFSQSEKKLIRDWLKNSLIDVRDMVGDTLISKSEKWIQYSQKLGQFESYESDRYKSAYDYYKEEYYGNLRERILIDYLFRIQGADDSDSLFRDATLFIKDQYYRSEIASYLNKQGRGERAVDFSLLNVNDEEVRLSDFKGKVVFLDFWFIGCSFCKSYFKNSIQPAEKLFKLDPSVIFISICVEKDKDKWLNTIKENTYTSEHSVNLYTGSLGWLHPIIKEYAVASAPKPLLIDKNGFIYTNSDVDLGRLEPDKLVQTIRECSVL